MKILARTGAKGEPIGFEVVNKKAMNLFKGSKDFGF